MDGDTLQEDHNAHSEAESDATLDQHNTQLTNAELTFQAAGRSKASYGGKVTQAYNAFRKALEDNDAVNVYVYSDSFTEAFLKFDNSHHQYLEMAKDLNDEKACESANNYYQDILTKRRFLLEKMEIISRVAPENPTGKAGTVVTSEGEYGITLGDSALKSTVTSTSNRSSRTNRSRGSSLVTKIASVSAKKKQLEAQREGLERVTALQNQQKKLEKLHEDIQDELNKTKLDNEISALTAYETELTKHVSSSHGSSRASFGSAMTRLPVTVKTEPPPHTVKTEPIRPSLRSHRQVDVRPKTVKKLDYQKSETTENNKCLHCNIFYGPNSRFCSACGEPLGTSNSEKNQKKSRDLQCSNCNFPLLKNAEYCESCGENVKDKVPIVKHTKERHVENESMSESSLTDSASNAVLDMLVLSQAELPTFNGNYTEFSSFIQQFDSVVHFSSMKDPMKLSKLLKYCVGEPHELISHCALPGNTRGYLSARAMLIERYGNKNRIAKSWIEKLINGPLIKYTDKKGWKKFSDELTACYATLKSLDKLDDVDNHKQITAVAFRLPYQTRVIWVNRASEIEVEHNRKPHFGDFSKFVKIISKARNNPFLKTYLMWIQNQRLRKLWKNLHMEECNQQTH